METFTLSWRKVHTQNTKRVRKQNHESEKRERGVKEDSSFRLHAPENAVAKLAVPILLEHGTPTISVEIEGYVEEPNVGYRLQLIDHAARHIEK